MRSSSYLRRYHSNITAASIASVIGLTLMVYAWVLAQQSAVAAISVEAAGSNGTIVRCEPPAALAPPGEPLSVDLYVENVAELNAADLRLSFDPAIAEVADQDAEADGTQIELLSGFLQPDFVLRDTADNEAGTIWYAATQVGREAVSGSGPVARVRFSPLTTGAFTMPFTFQELSRPDGSTIPATAEDCTIRFGEGTPVVEPSPTTTTTPTAPTPTPTQTATQTLTPTASTTSSVTATARPPETPTRTATQTVMSTPSATSTVTPTTRPSRTPTARMSPTPSSRDYLPLLLRN